MGKVCRSEVLLDESGNSHLNEEEVMAELMKNQNLSARLNKEDVPAPVIVTGFNDLCIIIEATLFSISWGDNNVLLKIRCNLTLIAMLHRA